MSVAGALEFHDNVIGTVVLQSAKLAANGVSRVANIGEGLLGAAANNVLKLDVTATGAVSGMVFGTEE